MKKILDFFKLILLCLWAQFLRIYKVLAVILLFLLVSFLVGIFISPTLMVLMWAIGMLAVSLFLFIPRCKQTAADIYIIRKGDKYDGNCLGMSRQYRSASTLFVEWTDSDNTNHKRSFYAIDNRSKYPHSVNVYSYNNDPEQTNLGWRTLIEDIVYMLIFLPFVVLSVYLNYALIHEIIQNGINSIT